MDFERRKIVVLGADICTHLTKRSNDTLHRAFFAARHRRKFWWVNCWPLRIPERSRMVVPEFSASRARQLDFRPCKPCPVIFAVVPSTLTSAPKAFMQPRVLWQSWAAAKLRSSLTPSARAASMA